MGKMMGKVLLTGATGYLGFRILKRLIGKGFEVVVIKRENSMIDALRKFSPSILFYNNDDNSISQAFKDNAIDLVIHTATAYGRKGESFKEIKVANFDLPFNILVEALKNKVNYFINTGTSLPSLTNEYSFFKNQFKESLAFCKSKITSINILLEHFYGPGDDPSKFITGMIEKMKANVDSIDLTAGTQVRDFIFVEDVLDAYMTIIDNLESFHGSNDLPLGSGEPVTIRKLVQLMKEISGSSSNLNFGAIEMRTTELLHSDSDTSILNKLGWETSYTLEQGLKITIDA
jgi:CDP-paratose synthetase